MSDAELQRDLQRLREDYLRKLPAKLTTLEKLLNREREAPQERLEEARRLAHTLKGTSGSYGLDDLCAEFRRIEEGLDRMLEEAPSGPSAAWDEIEGAVARVKEILGR